MSFSSTLANQFGKVVDRSPYAAQDPIVKLRQSPKGNNVVFGSAKRSDQFQDLIYLGKIFESSTGKSYLGSDAWLDIAYPHVIYITGTRGSGKSFDLGVLLEGISSLVESSSIQHDVRPQTSFLIDLQNQFWTLAFPPRDSVPENTAQLKELSAWNIAPNSLADCHVFVPEIGARPTGTELRFSLSTRDVFAEEWCALLSQPLYSPQGHIISRTIDSFGDRAYTIAEMLSFIRADAHWPATAESSRRAVTYKLDDLDRSKIFSKAGLNIADLLVPGRCNVFMLRELRNEDKSLVTAILTRQLFRIMGDYHSKKKIAAFFGTESPVVKLPSRVWLFIDEAHVVAPKDQESPAREALVEYVKRGRDAGLSLVLATQQPAAVDDRILSQVNLSFNHRLTFQSDITAAVNRVPTKTLNSLKVSGTTINDFGDMLRLLDSGQCFIGDHSTSRAVLTMIRPRVTSHGGYNPS
jgi:hypothetical protein